MFVGNKVSVGTFMLLVFQGAANSTVILSPTQQYTLCTLLSKGGNGMVYTGIGAALTDSPATCDLSAERVIVKCGAPSFQAIYESEYEYMLLVQSASWAPRVYELFPGPDGGPCMTMQRLGLDLEKLRLGYTGKWPSVTLGSIGAKMVDIVDELHNQLGITHTDLHLGNFALGLPSSNGDFSQNLFVIDFGDTRPLVDSEIRTRKKEALLEIRQIVISVRYLFDADFVYYVDKRYTYNETQICSGIPTLLCEALQYVYALGDEDEVDYPRVKAYFEALMGSDQVYSGLILWDPLVATLGWPLLAKEKNLFKPQPGDISNQGPVYGPHTTKAGLPSDQNEKHVDAQNPSTPKSSSTVAHLFAILVAITVL